MDYLCYCLLGCGGIDFVFMNQRIYQPVYHRLRRYLLSRSQLCQARDNKMPHLIQLEYTIEEVGILSDSSTEPCLAYLLKTERVTQLHG